jgi:hypothetical protein
MNHPSYYRTIWVEYYHLYVVATLVKVKCAHNTRNYIISNDHVQIVNIVQHVCTDSLGVLRHWCTRAKSSNKVHNSHVFTLHNSHVFTLKRPVFIVLHTPVGYDQRTKHGEWLCNECGKSWLKSGGWTNFLNHLGGCKLCRSELQNRVPAKPWCLTKLVALRRLCFE